MFTQCPHCTASFRVLDTQLQAAHGKVRCGACMKVFNAAEHLLTDDSAVVPTDDSMLDGLDHDGDFENLMRDSEVVDHGSDQSHNSAPQTNQEKASTLTGTSSPSLDTEEFSETFKHLSEVDEQTVLIDRETLQEEQRRAAKSTATRKNPAQPKAGLDQSLQAHGNDVIAADRRLAKGSDEPIYPVRPEVSHRAKPALEVDRSGEWSRKLLWTLFTVVVLIIVVMQLAWFQFDNLARHHQLRPIYQQACQLIGCQLPSLLDINQIRSQNLVVRSHPLVTKALIIDAVIVNEANFEQPFPDIALTFSDINNKVIENKSFTPGEYLSDEARQLPGLPANVPVHIALEILDPGKEAVNYSMGFIPNKAYLEEK